MFSLLYAEGSGSAMAQRYSYADSLKLLGKGDSEILDLAEKLADGGLDMLGVPDMFGLREKLVNKGRKALEGIGGKLRGESRMSRTEKIMAAHQILVVVAFFDTVEEEARRTETPLSLADLELTKDEQQELVGIIFDHTYTPRKPSATLSSFRDSELTGVHHQNSFDEITGNFRGFIAGLACAENLGIDSPFHPILERWMDKVSERSLKCYEEYSLRLAAEVPEFGMWIHVAEHTRTRARVETGLALLRERLDTIGSGRSVVQRQRDLEAVLSKALDRPMLPVLQVPSQVRLPTLGSGYIPPRGKIRNFSLALENSPSLDSWWEDIPIRDNLEEFFASHLVHPHATTHPTVILGHPGSGKSTFTEVLAAQLPAADFQTIRVELRSVPADVPIPVQINKGIHEILHEQISWRELLESTDGALPVIILDGFDELLQASGMDRSHYLENVQEFQNRQEAMGQPVVVIVTGRTVVADRMRFPNDTTVVRLEPFDTAQIEQFLQVWNRKNLGVLAARKLKPLTSDIVLRYQELAEQPLLLMMLLLYDADCNALRHAAGTFSYSELYERLLTMFAEREVEKLQPHLVQEERSHAVKRELRLLEIAALAMFTRRRQTLDTGTLDKDLVALARQANPTAEGTDRRGRLSPAHKLLGRFFFVHEDRAVHIDGASSVFEFLHATFGEYLVARAVVTALEDLVDDRARSHCSRGLDSGAPLDDGELYAYSSFACYAGREKVVAFMSELLDMRLPPKTREACRDLIVELYREAPFPSSTRSLAGYEPVRMPWTQRQANYTANLVILLVILLKEPLKVQVLHPDAESSLREWRSTVSLWSTLPEAEWFSIRSTLRMRHRRSDDGTALVSVIEKEAQGPIDVGECIGFSLFSGRRPIATKINPYGLVLPYENHFSELLRTASLRGGGTGARLVLHLLPYLRHVDTDLEVIWHPTNKQPLWTVPHELLQLLLVPAHESPEARLDAYRNLLFPGTPLARPQLLSLQRAAEDLSNEFSPFFKHNELQACVWDYLNGLRTVALPGADRTELDFVLRALGKTTAFENRKDILALLDGATGPPAFRET